MQKQPGKKHNDELKEKAFALLVCNNASYVAKELGLPYTTVKTWENKFIKEGKKKIDEERETSSDDENNLVKLRNKKREQFINNAWKLIDDSVAVAQKRINKAKNLESDIDNLCEIIKKNAGKIEQDTGIGWFDLLNIIQEIKSFKSPKLSEISTLIGTIYDKQALANGEATSREEQILKGFEDY